MTNEEAELLAGMTVGKLTNVLKTEVVQALADKVEFNIRDMLDQFDAQTFSKLVTNAESAD